MTIFIGPDYKESKDVSRLAELCDIVKCVTDCKPRNGKVMPLTSKSFDRFEGLFLVYLDDRPIRNDITDALKYFIVIIKKPVSASG
jgi:sensor histidine kinase YesM